MEKILLVIHVVTALAIIGFILIQQGKGAEAGASFGAGSSQTVFGSSGSWNFFSKVTALLATVFFITSLGLAVTAKNRSNVGDKVLPAIEQYQIDQQVEISEEFPQADSSYNDDEIPVVEETEIPGDSEIPVQ